ncbi:MAG: tetratricopeptide repeat protein [Verrucomicrobia bacterium]|nr:tetratricopeptide repeat protein [Verrucomicrobiota bacterium]
MPRNCSRLLVASCLLLTVVAPSLHARDDDAVSSFDRLEPVRKEPGLFRHAEKATPSDQLAFADEQLARQRIRRAKKAYNDLVHLWHDTPEAAVAQRLYADLLLQEGRHQKAFEAYQYLIDHFAGQFDYNDVLAHQFQIANYIRTERHGGFFFFDGYAAPERALPLYEKIVRNGPTWSHTPEAQFYIGLIHEERKDYALAVPAFQTLELRFPQSDLVASAAFRRASTMYQLAQKSPRDEEQSQQALVALLGFRRRFPTDPNIDSVRRYEDVLKNRLASMSFERAEFYDKVAKRPKSAIIAYSDFINKFPKSVMRRQADNRIAALKKEIGETDEY